MGFSIRLHPFYNSNRWQSNFVFIYSKSFNPVFHALSNFHILGNFILNSKSASNSEKVSWWKILFLSKPPKITFRTPRLQTLIKPVGNIFDRRNPKKPTLNWSFPTNRFCQIKILFFLSNSLKGVYRFNLLFILFNYILYTIQLYSLYYSIIFFILFNYILYTLYIQFTF